MMNPIRNSSGWIVTCLVMLILVAGGCKSKKKAMEAANAAERARMEQEASLKKQRDLEEEERKKAADEKARREGEARETKVSAPQDRLEKYFTAIASANSTASANQSIDEALTLFASDQTPVLIVISEVDGEKDYDRPTTIRAYLNYLKDQKKNVNTIGKLHFDNSEKIVEVELVKQK